MKVGRHAASVLLVGTLSGLGAYGAGLPPTEVYAKVSPSIWRVATFDADGVPIATGSAVVIAKDTLVTNCHVLARARRVKVRHEQVSLIAHLELWDPPRDVCQIHVEDLAAPAVQLGATSTLKIGQDVYAIGNPKGLDLTMSSGLLSSIRRNEREQIVLLQTSAAISGGSSGGGLFDERGALIGLTTLGSVGDAQNLNFAVPVDWIRELPERHASLIQSKPANAMVAGVVAAVDPPPAADPAPLNGQGSVALLDDVSRLPFANDRMRDRYRVFLTRPLPRAFAVSEGGSWYQAWGRQPTSGIGPAVRALRGCEKLDNGRCFVYVEDNRVVYSGPSGR